MKSQFKLLASACALLVSFAKAESGPDFERPISNTPTDPGERANSSADLAKTLANPIGALISVPFQNNSDLGGGPAGDGFQFIQPFVSYTTKTSTTSTTSTTFTLNTESSYDWTHDQWTLPLNVMVQQIVKIGKQPVALSLGARDYADKPDDGPNGGLRFAVIFLFPRS